MKFEKKDRDEEFGEELELNTSERVSLHYETASNCIEQLGFPPRLCCGVCHQPFIGDQRRKLTEARRQRVV